MKDQELKKLIELRTKLRSEQKYEESDRIREQIEASGYLVSDIGDNTKVTKKQGNLGVKAPYILIFGSGEIAPSSVNIHEIAIKALQKDTVNIVIISTPAGFQPNIKVVCEEIAEFFKVRLQNYHPNIEIIYANDKYLANDLSLLKPLEAADYILIGPGSPTYAVRNLKNTLLYNKIIEKVKSGTSIAIASAASIAFSKYVLPVYEIYKAGFDLYWEEGLDFYSEILETLTIIPHFNNKEGGLKTDTSHCFMGVERFNKLLKLLPKDEKVWGIDEHTAVVINIDKKESRSIGKGKLHELNS